MRRQPVGRLAVLAPKRSTFAGFDFLIHSLAQALYRALLDNE
jgi:hypothetical protein